MPNKTVYISPENEPRWEEFKASYSSLNNFLTTSASGSLEKKLPQKTPVRPINTTGKPRPPQKKTSSVGEILNVPQYQKFKDKVPVVIGSDTVMLPQSPDKSYDYCKHGNIKGFCKKGCK